MKSPPPEADAAAVPPAPPAPDPVTTSADAGASPMGANDGGACTTTLYPDVAPIFATYCATCHADRGWDSTCSAAQDDASEIYGKVASGKMPKGGGLPASDKATLLKWVDDGALCSASGC